MVESASALVYIVEDDVEVARLVEVGSVVRRGQVLARLDPAQETLHVAAATADFDAARSRVAQNRVDLQRAELSSR